jgi:hypothetical protein
VTYKFRCVMDALLISERSRGYVSLGQQLSLQPTTETPEGEFCYPMEHFVFYWL